MILMNYLSLLTFFVIIIFLKGIYFFHKNGLLKHCLKSIVHRKQDISKVPSSSNVKQLLFNDLKGINRLDKCTFLDFGCGDGEIVLDVGLNFKMKKIIGVEINSDTAKIANENLNKINKCTLTKNIQIINKDICDIEIKYKNLIFYLYEPLWNVKNKKKTEIIYKKVFNKLVDKSSNIIVFYQTSSFKEELKPNFFTEYGFEQNYKINNNSTLPFGKFSIFYKYTLNT